MNYSKVFIPACLSVLILAGCGKGDDDKEPPKPKPNTAPTATQATFSTQAETTYSGMLQGVDADMDSLTFAVGMQPTQGTLTLQSSGAFTYLPNAEVTGTDKFTFTVTDGKSVSAAANVYISVDLLQVSFNDYSRAAFTQSATATAMPLNSRSVTQDVTTETAYDDLLMP